MRKNTALFMKKTTINVQQKSPAVPGTTQKSNKNKATVKSRAAVNLGRNLDKIKDVINNAIINMLNISVHLLLSICIQCFPAIETRTVWNIDPLSSNPKVMVSLKV